MVQKQRNETEDIIRLKHYEKLNNDLELETSWKNR